MTSTLSKVIDISNNNDYSDILIPKDLRGTPLKWDGNSAHIEGLLYETGEY